jgi:hypothetical protein
LQDLKKPEIGWRGSQVKKTSAKMLAQNEKSSLTVKELMALKAARLAARMTR